MLDIIASYHLIQFQEKLTIQTQENGEEPHFGPDLGLLCQNSGRKNFFIKLVLRHCSNLPYCAMY